MTVTEGESVEVPAGTFRAAKVVLAVTEREGKPLDRPYESTCWHAKGGGLVRGDWDGSVRALKSFTPGRR